MFKIIIPLSLGYFLSKFSQKWDNRKNQKKSIQDLISEIRLLKDPIRLQIESINTFLDHLKNEKEFTVPILHLQSNLLLDRIETINRTLVLEYLKRKLGDTEKGLKRTNQLFGNLGVIKSQAQEIIKDFHDYLVRSGIQFQAYNDATDALFRLRREHLVSIERAGNDPASDEFFNTFSDLFEKLRQDQKRDIFQVHEYFIDELVKINAHHRINPLASDYSDMIYLHDRALLRMKGIRTEMVTRFTNHSDTISSYYQKLEEYIADIKS